jgi:hypothetical protein
VSEPQRTVIAASVQQSRNGTAHCAEADQRNSALGLDELLRAIKLR